MKMDDEMCQHTRLVAAEVHGLAVMLTPFPEPQKATRVGLCRECYRHVLAGLHAWPVRGDLPDPEVAR